MASHKAARVFAWYSVTLAVLHFTGETIYHFRFGQFLPGLIVDYIAVSLLLRGAWLLLFKAWSAGVLCGAWGFEFCLCYRSFFWRVEDIFAGNATELTRNTAYILGFLLVLSMVSFVYSVWLCRPSTPGPWLAAMERRGSGRMEGSA